MKKLLKISLSISLIGILFLLFLSNNLSPKQINIKDINNKLLNQKVKVQGQVFNIRTYEDSNFQIISIKDTTGKIDTTLNNPINITNNQTIIVIGIIKEYNKTLQIQAEKIISHTSPTSKTTISSTPLYPELLFHLKLFETFSLI